MRGRSIDQTVAYEASFGALVDLLAAAPRSVRELRNVLRIEVSGRLRRPSAATIYARLAVLASAGMAVAEERGEKIAGKSGPHEMVWRLA